MVIYLPSQSVEEGPVLDELTPREIVRELDKYVIGQPDAKRAVAIALRNRLRRQKLPPEMAEDVMPKNIVIDMVREEKLDEVGDRAEAAAENRLLELLVPPAPDSADDNGKTREKLR